MGVVVLFDPFHLTTDDDKKPVPFTVKVNVELPTKVDTGDILVIVGSGLTIVKVTVLEVPPPGNGLNTVMLNVPVAVRSDAGIDAVSCIEFTNEVDLSLPFHLTTDEEIKLDPLTVRVKAELLVVVDDGDILIIIGTGFWHN